MSIRLKLNGPPSLDTMRLVGVVSRSDPIKPARALHEEGVSVVEGVP